MCKVKHIVENNKQASVVLDEYDNDNGKMPKEIKRIFFTELRCSQDCWKCWNGGIIANYVIRDTPDHDYAILTAYTYMVKIVNPGSINAIVDE